MPVVDDPKPESTLSNSLGFFGEPHPSALLSVFLPRESLKKQMISLV
jgi:hypothetical protein